MAEKKSTILIVDDSIENIKILLNLLESDHHLFFAKGGKKALEVARSESPELILLDIAMPEMDGYEVCRRLKADSRTKDIPVIFISARSDAGDETRGLEIGAIDYITKPFNPAIVKARVKNHLRLQAAIHELKSLYSRALDANPMTGLPGNNSISAGIKTAMKNGSAHCLIYTDLDNFKAFNDKYGFARGDDVILFTSRTLKQAIEKADCPDAFIGHIGGDDFILLVPSERCDPVVNQIARLFDRGILQFYDEVDVGQRCISSVDRRGEAQTYPIMSISLAGVDLARKVYPEYIEVIDACAELKKKAKAVPGSHFCLDRRGEPAIR